MVLSIIFLEDKHNILFHLSIFYEYQVFSTPYLFLDTAATSTRKGHGRIRGIFGPLLKNLHVGICVRDDLKTKRNGRKNCSDFYFGCLATKINRTLNLH